MSEAINNYRNVVEQPWGRMFYDLVWRQLPMEHDKRLRILDFGAGFCITSDYYARYHDVTAVEPNKEMYDLRVKNNDYELVTQGIDYLKSVANGTYDVVICHNVLEYVDNIDAYLKELMRVVKPGGLLSIVKHNEYGKVLAFVVLNDNPKAALELLEPGNAQDSMFGQRKVYDDTYLSATLAPQMTHVDTYGIRTFYGLSSNNDIKFNDDWYKSMLELEIKASTIDAFKQVAFFHHLLFKKK